LKTFNGIVYVTAEEMRELDDRVIRGYSIDVRSLMENAGVSTADMARRMLGGDVRGKRIGCLAGKGNNGGDGFVAARHLHDWGADVEVLLAAERENVTGVPSEQLSSLERMNLRILSSETPLAGFSLLIDALLGYSAKGDPREPMARLIRRANASTLPILALDLPSGLDPTSGEPHEPCIEAKATITLGLPKVGFLNVAARRLIGELYLADISFPPAAYAEYSQPPGLFDKARTIRIW
jgi:NAD(P)H-hydrate epimerase